jgi:hypothetical protein
MPEHDPEKLKAFWEYCEAFKGWAKLLLAGNAAGLGYCLTHLNSGTPKYNVGAFVGLFGAGVLLGGLYFLVLTILKAEVTTAIVTQQRPGPSIRGTILEVAGHVGMWGSAATVVRNGRCFDFRSDRKFLVNRSAANSITLLQASRMGWVDR